MSSVFNNIGKQIKVLASVFLWGGWILSLIACIVLLTLAVISSQASLALHGAVIFIGGLIASWLNSIFIYAFGSLVDNSEKIARNTYRNNDSV